MSDIPDLETIQELLDMEYTDIAIKRLDELLTLYAKEHNVQAIYDILEVLHLRYLDVDPIRYRLILLRQKLGLSSKDDFWDF